MEEDHEDIRTSKLDIEDLMDQGTIKRNPEIGRSTSYRLSARERARTGGVENK